MAKRKFTITLLSVETEVFPINDDDLQYKFKKVKGTVAYEKTLESKLKFGNNSKLGITDFDFFYGYESNISTKCTEFIATIYRWCNDSWVVEFVGAIALNEGLWDLDRCTVDLTLRNNTGTYAKIDKIKNKNVFPLSSYFQLGFFDYATMVDSNGQNDNHYLFYRSAGVPYFVNIDRLITSIFQFHPLVEALNTPQTRYPYELFGTICHDIVRELLIECGADPSINPLHSDFFDWEAIGDTPGYVGSGTALLTPSENKPNTVDASNGWHEMYLPIDRGTNYVTGTTNKLTHLVVFCKSNINNTTASEWEAPISAVYNSTTSAYELVLNSNKITFEDIEKIWATMFQAFWFIDTDGSMRVEHISWFNNNSHLYDSTSATNMKFNVAKNKYEYDKNSLPNLEKFQFQTNRDILNGGIIDTYANQNNEIFYESVCVNQNKGDNEVEYTLPLVVTDINAIDSDNLRPGIYDKKGLFMCQVSLTSNNGNYFNSGAGTLGTGYWIAYVNYTIDNETLVDSLAIPIYENGHVQWANLIRRYLKDNRVLTVGENGGDLITFTARTVKSKKQKDIVIQNCCGDDEFIPEQALVRTELGDGEIDEAVYSTKTETIKMNLLHD